MLLEALIGVLTVLPVVLGVANKGSPPLAKRDIQLSCVQFKYGGPFPAFGEQGHALRAGMDGWVNLYSNVTVWHPDNQTYTFDQTRLAVIDNKVQPCGECQTGESFGFEVCEGPDGKAYGDILNTATNFYGHLLWKNNGVKHCLMASRSAGNLDGIDLVPGPCQYNFDVVQTNGQYFLMDANDGVFKAQLVQNLQGVTHVYGPSPDGKSLYDMEVDGRPWTYYGFGTHVVA